MAGLPAGDALSHAGRTVTPLSSIHILVGFSDAFSPVPERRADNDLLLLPPAAFSCCDAPLLDYTSIQTDIRYGVLRTVHTSRALDHRCFN